MKKVHIILLVLSLILLSACGVQAEKEQDTDSASANTPIEGAVDVAWKCSTQDKEWQEFKAAQLIPGASGQADLSIDTSSLGQEIQGFGGAFNEKGWAALSALTPEERGAVMGAMFDPVDGAKFNICRAPIGASDYAVSRYTLDETKDDYEMNDFSIERDKEYLIPYIKAAMQYRPDLKVWGSAWTPPTWMKTIADYDGGQMKDDPKVYQAYALYLARFVESYRAEGINVFAVAVQNEPLIDRNYPTCLWNPKQFGIFVRDHMGPLFEQRKVKASIMFGTFQDPDFSLFPRLLNDPDVNKYVSIVGFQWDGLSSVARTRETFPDKLIFQTETECGNFYWKSGYDPNRPHNDWAYGVYTWNKVKDYFDEGANAYMLWNMVLDEEGKSIDSQDPWPQNAAITVDRNTKKVTYTPMFWAFKHFSYYVQPGARYVDTGKAEGAIAFLNPDGSLVIELQNESNEDRTLTIAIDGGALSIELPGMSWSTLVVPKR